MDKVDSGLRAAWRSDADAELPIIVHVDEPAKRLPALKEQGLVVRHVYTLTRAVAGVCRAGRLRDLADLPFVTRIEPDRPVRGL